MGKYQKVAMLFIVLSLAACASGPDRDTAASEEGYRAMQTGDLEKAESLLTDAVEENPSNWQAVTNLATLYQMTNRPEQARPLYQRVIDADKNADEDEEDEETLDELARLAKIARDNIAQMDNEEAMQQERLRQESAVAAQAATIETVKIEPEVPAPVQKATGYRIQVGAYAVSVNAEKMQAQLMRKHANHIKDMEVLKVEADRLIKVQIGHYRTMADANNACRDLKKAGVDCFPVKW